MEIDLKNINDRINIKRDELNKAIEQNKSKDFIYNLSTELDKIIDEYIIAKQFNEECKSYNKLLDTDYKNEIIILIKDDVKKQIPELADDEIECFSNNVYIYACLVANNIDSNEISKILVLHNKAYNKRIGELDKAKEENFDLNFCTNIAKKYLRIIKNR